MCLWKSQNENRLARMQAAHVGTRFHSFHSFILHWKVVCIWFIMFLEIFDAFLVWQVWQVSLCAVQPRKETELLTCSECGASFTMRRTLEYHDEDCRNIFFISHHFTHFYFMVLSHSLS